MCVQSRLSEIVKRYGPFDMVTRFITKAKPHLVAHLTRFCRAFSRNAHHDSS